ncbi:hypothetical protein MU582_13475 [Nocardioidaceae bacterium SCSIO 66511]|nr:hypothetical protein MU582_13475 [Nocardioidaceae bacterium SCSIO 66511]
MKTILLTLVLLVGCAPASSEPAHAPDDARWASVLRTLDAARARAFVRGDPSLLDRVYAPGSAVRRADADLIEKYARRGLHLDAVPMRVRDVEVAARTDGRVRLRVVDRLGRVRVREDAGPWRTLPDDRPSEHLIALRRVDAGWRITAISRVAG